MVITNNGINRLQYINAIKAKATEYYDPRDILHLALPVFDMSEEEYFKDIAKVFNLKSKTPNQLCKGIIDYAHNSQNKIFLLITDFENDVHLDDFAKLMRAVLDKEGLKLRIITIGGQKLANLKTNMGINSYFNYFNKVYINKGL